MNLILASNSPRRRQLLALGGWDYAPIAVEVNEDPLPGEKPADYVVRLASSKAQAIAAQTDPEAIIIGSDTTVAADGAILGKPIDAADAERMLRRLRGRVHQVYTALAVLRRVDRLLLTDYCITDVLMRDYTDSEMLAYIQSGDPMDKAGAYAIQHSGFHPVAKIEGCFANVMGLPLCHLARLLGQIGITPRENISLSCQSALEYDCSISPLVLENVI